MSYYVKAIYCVHSLRRDNYNHHVNIRCIHYCAHNLISIHNTFHSHSNAITLLLIFIEFGLFAIFTRVWLGNKGKREMTNFDKMWYQADWYIRGFCHCGCRKYQIRDRVRLWVHGEISDVSVRQTLAFENARTIHPQNIKQMISHRAKKPGKTLLSCCPVILLFCYFWSVLSAVLEVSGKKA